MAWIKWITEIRVVERPFLGYWHWQARDYFRWERGLGEPALAPLSEVEVKAQIARPVHGATIQVDRPYRIFEAPVCCGASGVSAWRRRPTTAVRDGLQGGWQAGTSCGRRRAC